MQNVSHDKTYKYLEIYLKVAPQKYANKGFWRLLELKYFTSTLFVKADILTAWQPQPTNQVAMLHRKSPDLTGIEPAAPMSVILFENPDWEYPPASFAIYVGKLNVFHHQSHFSTSLSDPLEGLPITNSP